MPTLFRLLVVLGLVCAVAYGTMVALVTLVHPEQRQIEQSITLPKQPK